MTRDEVWLVREERIWRGVECVSVKQGERGEERTREGIEIEFEMGLVCHGKLVKTGD